jgi:diamine N-acetyltransferase
MKEKTMSEPVYLRSLEMADLERCHRWHNDPDLYQHLGNSYRPVSQKSEAAWLESKASWHQNEFNLAICLTASDEHIGNIYLRDIDWVSRRAELHIFIGDKTQRSKGCGQSAVRQLVRYAFDELGLQRVFLFVLEDNQAARRSYEKCGFQTEGTMQRHVFKNGQFKNLVVMGVNK